MTPHAMAGQDANKTFDGYTVSAMRTLRRHWREETSQPRQGVHFFAYAVSGVPAFPDVPQFCRGTDVPPRSIIQAQS